MYKKFKIYISTGNGTNVLRISRTGVIKQFDALLCIVTEVLIINIYSQVVLNFGEDLFMFTSRLRSKE